MLAGITMSPIPEMEYDLLYGERTVKTVANATRTDAREPLRPGGPAKTTGGGLSADGGEPGIAASQTWEH